MTPLLIALFVLVIAAGLGHIFPIRNTVGYRGEPWATRVLLIGNVLFWASAVMSGGRAAGMGLRQWFEPLAFTGDLAKPATLLTAQLVHLNVYQILFLLWLLWLIAPVMEERLRAHGLLALYFGGGAAALAVCGLLGRAAQAKIYLTGMGPGVFALLGACLVVYPFEKVIFSYNVLFFSWCGTLRGAALYLAPFCIAVCGLAAIAAEKIAGPMASGGLGHFGWLDAVVPVIGLGVGFVIGGLGFGLRAWRTRPSGGEAPAEAPTGDVVGRALDRMTAYAPVPRHHRKTKPTRQEQLQEQLATGDAAKPEEIEPFVEQCLHSQRDDMLEAAYKRFRERFPERCLVPGLQAAVAKRFEETGQIDLALDAYRTLIRSHGEGAVAGEARLPLARLLAPDPSAIDEAIEMLEAFLRGCPGGQTADEAARLLEELKKRAAEEDTYAGLGPHKPFRFGQMAGKRRWAGAEAGAGEAGAELQPKSLTVEDIIPDKDGLLSPAKGLGGGGGDLEVAAAMASAKSFAVILLHGQEPMGDEALAVLAEFWKAGRDEAASRVVRCQGVLLDDVPGSRATALARRLRRLNLPVAIVPLLPEISYPMTEEVLEFDWNAPACGNVTTSGQRAFEWDKIRLANVAGVAVPGQAGEHHRVMDIFVGRPPCHLRLWEDVLRFSRSSLSGKQGAARSLGPLVAYLDERTPQAVKTPSFRAVAEKSAPPVDFSCVEELDDCNRWFLYAGFGRYVRSQPR